MSWFYEPSSEDSYQLGIRSVSPSDQSPRCPHEEILGPYPSRNFAEFLREMSRRKPSEK